MSYVEQHSQSHNVQWGKVVAGAAVATGAVLMGVAIAQGDIPILLEVAKGVGKVAEAMFSGIADGITAMFNAPAAAPTDTSVFKSFGDLIAGGGKFITDNAASLGGATLLGGGLAYTAATFESSQGQAAPALAMSEARVQNAQMGFAAREQMRAVNALIQARMQTFGGAQAPSEGQGIS